MIDKMKKKIKLSILFQDQSTIPKARMFAIKTGLRMFLLCVFLLTAISYTARPQILDPEFVKAQVLESQGKNEEALAMYTRL
jgi:hypothetical protein